MVILANVTIMLFVCWVLDKETNATENITSFAKEVIIANDHIIHVYHLCPLYTGSFKNTKTNPVVLYHCIVISNMQ